MTNPYLDIDGPDVDQAFIDSRTLCCLFTQISKLEESLKSGEVVAAGLNGRNELTASEASAAMMSFIRSDEVDKVSDACVDSIHDFRDMAMAAVGKPAHVWRGDIRTAKMRTLLPMHAYTQEVLTKRHKAWTGTVGERR